MRHRPLADVTVTFEMDDDNRGAIRVATITDANGYYQLVNIPAQRRLNLIALAKAGYCQRNTITLTNDGKDSNIDDAVMAACTTAVRGKVYNSAGKPLQGATVVSVESGLSTRVITDASGAFILTNQPEGELHLIAATTTGGGLATCSGQHLYVNINCMPGKAAHPVDIQLVQELLDADNKLPREQRRFNRSETLRLLADIDLELAVRLSQQGAEPVSEGLRAYLLGKQAEKEPAQVGEILAQLNLLKNTDCKLYASVEMGIAVAKRNPELAGQLYSIAKPIYDKVKHGEPRVNTQKIEGLGTFQDISLRIIALAGLLQKKSEVNAMLALLLAQGKTPYGMEPSITGPLSKAAGRVSPEFVFDIYDKIDDPHKFDFLPIAITSMTQRDLGAAQQLIQRGYLLGTLTPGLHRNVADHYRDGKERSGGGARAGESAAC